MHIRSTTLGCKDIGIRKFEWQRLNSFPLTNEWTSDLLLLVYKYEQGITKNNFDLFRSRSFWETITPNEWDSWHCKDDLKLFKYDNSKFKLSLLAWM